MQFSTIIRPLVLFAIFSLSIPIQIIAQSTPRFVDGEIIVMLKNGTSIGEFVAKNQGTSEEHIPVVWKESLSTALNLHIFTFDHEQIQSRAAINVIRRQSEVTLAQLNYYVSKREIQETFPSDPSFPSQWNLHNTGQNGGLEDADVDAPEAWDISTGGLSQRGDELLVAVLDDGFDLDHSDLNFWQNLNEIPDNDIDDDNNGYVDDFLGWDLKEENGDIPALQHGTEVSGIISARENGEGIVGLSWDTPILPISGAINAPISVFLQGYIYAFEMRKLHNQTNGAKGAFIVATNSSFGIDNLFAEEAPILCAIFDSLGQAGVLNIAATANSNVNVDIVGDIPSLCPSDHLIMVTNSTNQDMIQSRAALGPVSVDLAAPGANVLTTTTNGQYTTKNGTSYASPHVAAMVSLMLSSACPNLLAQYKNDPEATSLLFKEWILTSTDTLEDFSQTVSQGRLNAHKALLKVQAYCSTLPDCVTPSGFQMSDRTDKTATISWGEEVDALSYTINYRIEGDAGWSSLTLETNSINFSGLIPCTSYEIRVKSNCNSDSSEYSSPFVFKTDGCCVPPKNLLVSQESDNEIKLTWSPVFAAQEYEIQRRAIFANDTNWITTTSTDTTFLLQDEMDCIRYAFRIRTICENEQSEFTEIVKNNGCGACLNLDYCGLKGQSSSDEFIDSILIGTNFEFMHATGNDGGYLHITDSIIQLPIGQSIPFRFVPGYAGFPFSEFWRVWIDVNQDGDFLDEGEFLYNANSRSNAPLEDDFIIGEGALPGNTRMRIAMGAEWPEITTDISCQNFPFGEVEDYCVELLESVSISPEIEDGLNIYPNPTEKLIQVKSKTVWENFRLLNTLGQELLSSQERNNYFEIDLSKYAGSVFYIKFSFAEGEANRKVVKIQ